MKKYKLLTLLVLAALLLAGCTGDGPVPSEPSGISTEPTMPPTEGETIPVEADVIYYSNQREYSRLYSQRTDGSDLTLVLDTYCYSVYQEGDTVYFLDRDGLRSYHIPTGTEKALVDGVLEYDVEGEDLVYSVSGGETFVTELHHLDLATGEDVSIGTQNMGTFAFGFGSVYYTIYDEETGNVRFLAYDIESGETALVTEDFWSCYSMLPVEGGVYFEAYGDEADGWFFASGDDGTLEKVEFENAALSRIFHGDDQGIYYITWSYSDHSSVSIHFLSKDGTSTTLLETGDKADLSVQQIGADRWLVKETVTEGWGGKDEFDNYDHYATGVSYRLLTGEGTLTALEGVGEMGTMFAEGDFPVLDSSTARIPVTEALYELFVKNYGYEGAEPLCSTTHGAWLNIADRKVDLALLAAPTEEELAYLEQQNVEIEMKLYGGDGLVFIGNASNPVTDLTHEQIIAIYRGEITNWSEVGGPDHPITVYYRDDQSGSQRLFENLVFKGLEIPDFEGLEFSIMDEMSSLVHIVLEDPYAIGYSIMTYLDDVYAEEELQVFSVNGAAPSPQTIKDQSYPYNTRGYLVIRSDEPAGSPARRLFEWFGCPVSDDLLINSSVTPLHDDAA